MPAKEVVAICLHGVGSPPDTFSWNARRNLRAALKAQGQSLWVRDAYWAPVADFYEKPYLDAVRAQGSEINEAQKIAIMDAGDAFLYRNNALVREEIWETLDASYRYLHSSEVVIFAHSLGVLVAVDWLRDRGKPIKALHSFGDNLGLLGLGADFAMPEQLKAPGTWIDYWTPGDGLGFPLKAQPGFESVDSVKVNIGSWATHWTGLDHILWWENKDLWGKTIPRKLAVK